VLTLEWGTGLGIDPTYRGLDGVAEYMAAWMEPFSDYHVSWLDFIDQGQFVVIPTSQRGVGEGSGVQVKLDLVWVCEVKDRLVTRLLQFNTVEEARAAIAASA